jgi:hypothetical protein
MKISQAMSKLKYENGEKAASKRRRQLAAAKAHRSGWRRINVKSKKIKYRSRLNGGNGRRRPGEEKISTAISKTMPGRHRPLSRKYLYIIYAS